MYQQTKGIVLKTTNYGETSLICKIYTLDFGLQSYIVNSVRKKKGNRGYYQPLSLLEITALHKKEKSIHRIKETKTHVVLSEIPFNIYKSSIAIFMTEIIEKCLQEEEKNPPLFNFLSNAIIDLDQQPFDSQCHIQFMVEFSRYLGIYPNLNNDDYTYFDMLNGQFTNQPSNHPHYTTNTNDIRLVFRGQKASNKREVINLLLNYYALHIEGFKELKSKNILETILN